MVTSNANTITDGTVSAAAPATCSETSRWSFRGHGIHCLRAAPADPVAATAAHDRPPLLLIHGFGANTDHWRHNIPVLAQHHEVHAMDLLGFGLSAKPADITFEGNLWRDQVLAYTRERIERPTVFVGNSLGGYAALAAATAPESAAASAGVVLLNTVGRFQSELGGPATNDGWGKAIALTSRNVIGKVLVNNPLVQWLLFENLKRPANIRSTLKKVYVDHTHVDEELVNSIRRAALDPGAFKVFQAMFGIPQGESLDVLFAALAVPLLLVWGTCDPWIRPTPRLEMFREAVPQATQLTFEAGHCPHDERPDLVNGAMLKWLQGLPC